MNSKKSNLNRWILFIVPLMVLLVNLACGFSASTASIKEAKLARDNDGAQPTTTFAPSDTTFFVNVNLANAPDDTKVKAVWTAVEVQGAQPNTKIDETELTSGSGTLHFKLTTNDVWPTGKYKVDLYLNDKLSQSLDFQVQ